MKKAETFQKEEFILKYWPLLSSETQTVLGNLGLKPETTPSETIKQRV
jgi:hypothetical protein